MLNRLAGILLRVLPFFKRNLGAIGVILQNTEDSFVYPGMTGWSSSENLTIPGVMVSNTTGEKISMQLSEGKQVVVTLSGDVKEVSDFYAPPEGLTIM